MHTPQRLAVVPKRVGAEFATNLTSYRKDTQQVDAVSRSPAAHCVQQRRSTATVSASPRHVFQRVTPSVFCVSPFLQAQ